MYLGSLLVLHPADVNLDFTCCDIPIKPKDEIFSFNNGAGIAPTNEFISPLDFQNMEGNSIASAYTNGIDVPFEVAHSFCKKILFPAPANLVFLPC